MADAAIRNHLLVVVDAAVRGLVTPCIGRLTDHLRTFSKHFLVVASPETEAFASETRASAPKLLAALDDVVWAHEYADIGGDDHQRRHYVPEDETAVRIVFSRPQGLAVEGYMTSTWLAQPSRFGVVREPRPVGLTPLAERHAAAMRPLDYVVVNRSAVALVIPLDKDSP
jgi:hypothetical protein